MTRPAAYPGVPGTYAKARVRQAGHFQAVHYTRKEGVMTDRMWLEELFEYEYCAECGGDVDDHQVVHITLGAYGGPYRFAQCLEASQP